MAVEDKRLKKIDKERFEESLRQFLNDEINLKEASDYCNISPQLWSYRAKIYCERGGLPSEYWKQTEADLKEKEFWDSITETVEEEEPLTKRDNREKWRLKNFKHM